MREFETVVYMDLQKTGTTSIVEFLRTVLKEEETIHPSHSSAEASHDTTKFHFTSVRHPISLYISLFGHGVSGRGGLFKGLQRRGRAEGLYEPSVAGFSKWLEFMLDPKNASTIRKKYDASKMTELCGPLSHRLLMLSFIDPVKVLSEQGFKNRSDLVSYYHQHRIYDHYVRTEVLVPDLLEVWNVIKERASVKRRYRALATVDDLNAIMPRKNVGAKIEGLTRDAVPQELQARVREQEWLFFDIFGYDEGKGNPPPLPPATKSDGSEHAPSSLPDETAAPTAPAEAS